MKIKNKKVLKNGRIGGYVYYPENKKWKWRIIGNMKGGERYEPTNENINSIMTNCKTCISYNKQFSNIGGHSLIYKYNMDDKFLVRTIKNNKRHINEIILSIFTTYLVKNNCCPHFSQTKDIIFCKDKNIYEQLIEKFDGDCDGDNITLSNNSFNNFKAGATKGNINFYLQILIAFYSMIENKISHNDIKKKNILYKIIPTQKFNYIIGDKLFHIETSILFVLTDFGIGQYNTDDHFVDLISIISLFYKGDLQYTYTLETIIQILNNITPISTKSYVNSPSANSPSVKKLYNILTSVASYQQLKKFLIKPNGIKLLKEIIINEILRYQKVSNILQANFQLDTYEVGFVDMKIPIANYNVNTTYDIDPIILRVNDYLTRCNYSGSDDGGDDGGGASKT